MSRAPSRLSASAISRYLACPRQFFFADVERVQRDTRPSPQLTVANAVHHALERFFGLDPAARTPTLLETALRSVWPQHRTRETFGSRDEERFWGRQALAMLEQFSRMSDLQANPLAREQWLSTQLENGVELFGKLDRIDDANGQIDVLDYKTGRQVLDNSDLPREPSVQVYVALAERAYGRPVRRVRFLYLATGAEAVWEPEREDVVVLIARLVELASEIASADDFPAVPGGHCRFCPVALACPERQRVSLEDLVPVEGLPF